MRNATRVSFAPARVLLRKHGKPVNLRSEGCCRIPDVMCEESGVGRSSKASAVYKSEANAA